MREKIAGLEYGMVRLAEEGIEKIETMTFSQQDQELLIPMFMFYTSDGQMLTINMLIEKFRAQIGTMIKALYLNFGKDLIPNLRFVLN